VVEYGDFQCPYCGRAEPVVGICWPTPMCGMWRHCAARRTPAGGAAAEAAEAAAAAGRVLADARPAAERRTPAGHDLVAYATAGSGRRALPRRSRRHSHSARVARDVESARSEGVSGTPTFFINEARHYGAYDIATLTAAIKTAPRRAALDR